ncbi:PTS sugar transporter subunit IIA [Tetragenococcus solitarius]|uniref:PTS sugar transporter subunit IIA n=1 Tax=Tetragenococcus solitarius TaxID=71453 RepID=A0ABP6KNR5_9ENTE|nr:PTS sugar transporter subunit IIA [Tetragenococcus solitarius]
MTDFLIVTHGSLASGIIDSAKLIIGDTSNVSFLSFDHGDNPDELGQAINAKIQYSINQNRQLMIFTDLFGGTPANRLALVTKQLIKRNDLEILVGVNLPMLLEGLMSAQQNEDVKEIKRKCMKAGLDGIKDLKEAFNL